MLGNIFNFKTIAAHTAELINDPAQSAVSVKPVTGELNNIRLQQHLFKAGCLLASKSLVRSCS